ncbi:MAG: DUF5615 family PIN-like protein [Planctomycetia bacterium]
MRLLVDNQLPPALASWPRDQGHDAVHVADAGLERLDDGELWLHAVAEERIVVSKDEDFLYLASLAASGRLLWVRLGNCRNAALIAAFSQSMQTITAAFASDQRVVELV